MTMNRPASALRGLLIGGAFYLLLIDTVSPPELYAGAGATLLAAAAFEVSRGHGLAEGSPSGAWVARAWRVAWRVPVHIWLVCREAVVQLVLWRRGPRGRFRAVPFLAGGEGSRDVGRRALCEMLGSLTPNTIVIGVDPDRDLLLVHQLRTRTHPPSREELDVLGLG
jgi:multisubunit Na+/H+ antiporter MnhE subunit